MVLQNKHNKCVTVPHEEFCILICLSVETQLNRLWTSCSTSAEHHWGHHHLSEHTSSYLIVERRTAAWSHYVKRPESDKVTLDINKTHFTDCALRSSSSNSYLLWPWSASALGWTKTWVLMAPFKRNLFISLLLMILELKNLVQKWNLSVKKCSFLFLLNYNPCPWHRGFNINHKKLQKDYSSNYCHPTSFPKNQFCKKPAVTFIIFCSDSSSVFPFLVWKKLHLFFLTFYEAVTFKCIYYRFTKLWKNKCKPWLD